MKAGSSVSPAERGDAAANLPAPQVRSGPSPALPLGVAITSAFLLAVGTVSGAEPAMVEMISPATGAVWAGQPVPFAVELLVRGQFSGSPHFDLPEMPGAITMKASARPSLGVRDIGEESYTFQRHEFVLFPLRAGRCLVPPFTVRFASKLRFDQPAAEHRLSTPSFEVEAKAPPGARPGEVIVSTTDLQAVESWTPEPTGAKVGDAFTRTLVMRAEGVPGMLLPPAKAGETDGLAVYPKPPQVLDRTERGDFTGERLESVTYVCEQAGTFEIPAVQIRWWNPDAADWQEMTFPAVTLEVAENPALAADLTSPAAGRPSGPSAQTLLIAGFLLLAGLLATVLAGPRWLRRWNEWRRDQAAGEPARFRSVIKACRANDAGRVYRELNLWLAHFDTSTMMLIRSDNQAIANPLRTQLIEVQQRMAGMRPRWEGRILAEQARGLRGTLARGRREAAVSALGPLNPCSGAIRRKG